MMDEIDAPDECGVCGDELDGNYHVETYEVKNPTVSGYLNPFTVPGVFYWLSDRFQHELHLPVCNHCDAPETPPTVEEEPHHLHLVQSGLWAIMLGVVAIYSTAPLVEAVTVAIFAVALGAVALGEVAQIAFIRERAEPPWERVNGVEPVLADENMDDVEDAQEAFLAGEITEAEFEERLDEEFADTDDREPERVIDR